MKFKAKKLEPLEITIGGEKYPAKLNFSALSDLEELTGDSFIDVIDRISEGKFKTDDLLGLIYVSLKNGGVDIKKEDIYTMDFTKEILDELFIEVSNLLSRSYIVKSVIEKDKDTKTTKK